MWAIMSDTQESSIPHVSFVDLDAVFAAEGPEFVLERRRSVVFLLRGDIGADLFNIRLTDRESAVAALPETIPAGWHRDGFRVAM